MTVIETRVRENFPAIFMTMISLIVGLLFENLVSAMNDLDGLWEVSAESFFLWSQCLVLVVAPLLFWFTYSLNSSAVRAVFVPRLAFVPILAASGLFFFVSHLGAEYATTWLYAWGVIICSAWIAFHEFGSLYESDDEAPGDFNSHRISSIVMVGTGLATLGAGLLTSYGVLETLGAGIALLLSQTGAVVAHSLWYGEWKVAVGMEGA